MAAFVQRAGDRISGGARTSLKLILNGPVSCSPNEIFSRLDRLSPLCD